MVMAMVGDGGVYIYSSARGSRAQQKTCARTEREDREKTKKKKEERRRRL